MSIKTKYGSACITAKGYYQICTNEYGFKGQLLHRLIMADALGCGIPSNYVVHHRDENKLNNNINNLELLPNGAHTSLHWTGKTHTSESKLKISKSRNTTGYYRVTKTQCKGCKQGFIWRYVYIDENGKRKQIRVVDIKKLEEKVKARGLEWRKLE